MTSSMEHSLRKAELEYPQVKCACFVRGMEMEVFKIHWILESGTNSFKQQIYTHICTDYTSGNISMAS